MKSIDEINKEIEQGNINKILDLKKYISNDKVGINDVFLLIACYNGHDSLKFPSREAWGRFYEFNDVCTSINQLTEYITQTSLLKNSQKISVKEVENAVEVLSKTFHVESGMSEPGEMMVYDFDEMKFPYFVPAKFREHNMFKMAFENLRNPTINPELFTKYPEMDKHYNSFDRHNFSFLESFNII